MVFGCVAWAAERLVFGVEVRFARSSFIFLGRLVDIGGPAIVEIQGSAAWAVALQSGSAVLRRRPSHLWL